MYVFMKQKCILSHSSCSFLTSFSPWHQVGKPFQKKVHPVKFLKYKIKNHFPSYVTHKTEIEPIHFKSFI